MFDPDPKLKLRLSATVRAARPGDEEAIRDFGRRVLFSEIPSSEAAASYLNRIVDRYWSLDFLRAIVVHERCSVVVAEVNGNLVGLATALPEPKTPGMAVLSRLMVLPAYVSIELGDALLRACEGGLAEDVRALRTGVPSGDEAGLSFHERRGFVRRGAVTLGKGSLARPFIELVKPLRLRLDLRSECN